MPELWIEPDWPAPAGVRALSTTRQGGASEGPYASLNLGRHVGDDPRAVTANRDTLYRAAALPASPLWLNQVHGVDVAEAAATQDVGRPPEADAVVAREAGQVCTIMTADCLAVLFASRDGSCVAAAHAGWRGLAAGVLSATVNSMGCPPQEILAWLGPAIGPDAFEVGEEVRQAFVAQADEAAQCFRPQGDRWLADLPGLARLQLKALGITAVYGGQYCTWSDSKRFFSYRRDGQCGRMASLIWKT